jgi:CheY-like chemotaxis protein
VLTCRSYDFPESRAFWMWREGLKGAQFGRVAPFLLILAQGSPSDKLSRTGPPRARKPSSRGERRPPGCRSLEAPTPASAARTILIVDDELGHTVLAASNGVEALARVRREHGGVDLVLADIVMPQMNGTELAATVLDECPDMPVILMSAYVPAGLTQVGIHRSVVPVLMKPFTIDTLAELIQVALDLPGKRRRTSRPAASL